MKGPSTRLHKVGPPARPLKENALGTDGKLNTSNPGEDVPRVAPEAPNVSERRGDDAYMGDKCAQRDISDAASSAAIEFENHDAPRNGRSRTDRMFPDVLCSLRARARSS